MSIPSGSPVFMEDFVLVRKRPLSLQEIRRREGGREREERERERESERGGERKRDQPQL